VEQKKMAKFTPP